MAYAEIAPPQAVRPLYGRQLKASRSKWSATSFHKVRKAAGEQTTKLSSGPRRLYNKRRQAMPVRSEKSTCLLDCQLRCAVLYRAKTTWPTGRNAAEEQYHDSATGTFCQFATAHKKATTGVAISTAHLERPRRAQGSVAWRCSSLFHKETSSHGPLRWFLQLWLTVLYSSQHIVSQGVPQRTTPKCWVRLSSFVAQPCGLLLSPFF